MPAESSLPVEPQSALRAARLFLSLLIARSGRRALVLVLLLTLVGSLAEGAGLLLLVPVLDMIGIGGSAPPTLDVLVQGLGLYLLLVAVAAGLVAARNIIGSDQRNVFLDRLRCDLHEALLHASWPTFQSVRATDIHQIVSLETARLGACHGFMLSLAVSIMTVPALLVAALFLSPPLTLATLLVAGLALLLIRRIGRSGFDIGQRLSQASRAMMADLTDDLAGLRVIKGFGAEVARQANLERRFTDLRRLQHRHARIQALEHAALTVTAALVAAVAVLVALAWLALPLADALVAILAFARLAQRGLGGLRLWRQLEASLPAAIAYDEMLSRLRAGAERPIARVSDLPPLGRLLEVQAVEVRMADGRRALDGVDLALPFGAFLAVTGPSGAGKSTLADLAAGLAYPTAGVLCVDGVPLTPDRLPAWRRQVAMVPQDPFLFHDTVRANLLLAAPDTDETALWAALEDAAAADFVRGLPQGLDTIVGDRGGAVSGGERQRLAIARALLRRPRLLILDEATSALDAGSEALVLRLLDGLRGRVTILAVTHRDSTRRAADLVLELDGGRVRHFGPAQPLGAAPASPATAP